ADTLGAAWGLANFARTHAAATANPHAFFIAAPDQAANALAGLPCAALRLSPDHINTLRRLGIDRIEQLLSLPRDGLATRLGSQLCQRIAQALGEVQETVDTLESVLDLNASIEMDYPTDAEDILHDRLQRLTHQVTTRLRVEDKGILQMNLVIRQTDHPSVRAQIGLFAPTLETTHLSTLLVGALQQQRLQSKVTALELSVNLTGALETEQASLFEPTASSADVDETGSLDTNRWNHDPQVSRLIDTLRGRLGDDAVTRVQLDHNVLPESAYQRKATRTPMLKRPRAARKSRGVVSHEPSPASQATRMPSRARSHLPHRDDAGRRPLQLLNPAQPIMPLVPPGQQLSPDQFPNRFRYRGRVWIVSHHWGPERIETDWWRGPLIRRDYFRLELNDGVRWWVYRDLTIADPMAEKQVPSEDSSASHVIAPWMLHGFFD
ncbi:MAG: DNA polymerase Y family protein, partial [Planctomycetota bacterium]